MLLRVEFGIASRSLKMSAPLDEAWVRQHVPSLLDGVSVQRPHCLVFNTTKGCKKGKKCTNLHCKPEQRPEHATNAWRLPYVTRFENQLRIRAPLHDAFAAFFNQHQKPMVVGTGRVINATDQDGDEQVWLVHELQHMAPHDAHVCTKAELSRVASWPVSLATVGGFGDDGVHASGSEAWPSRVSAHGTTIEASLSVLVDGHIRPSPGIAGEGVYSFMVPHERTSEAMPSDEELLQAVQRCAAGGYNQGAIFIFKRHGILAKTGKGDWVVPPGATAFKKDQLASHPSTMEYLAVLWPQDMIVQVMASYMREGFSPALYDSFGKIVTHLVQDHRNTSSEAKVRVKGAT